DVGRRAVLRPAGPARSRGDREASHHRQRQPRAGEISPGSFGVRSVPRCEEGTMSRPLAVTLSARWLASLLALRADGQETAQKDARDTLARLEKGDPGGKERMR